MTETTHLPERHRNDQWKQPCRVATTAPVTISTAFNAGDTIDGVTLVAGDRILAKDQSAGAENGIYVAGPSPARAYDMDTADEVQGAIVYVKAGTANGGKAYKNTNTAAVTLGTTALTFAEFGAGGSGITVQEEGTPLATAKTTLNFVGTAVTATGAGTTGTITITGGSIAQITGSGGGHITFAATTTDMYSPASWASGDGGFIRLFATGVRIDAIHTPASAYTNGLIFQLGDDFLQVFLNELDASTIQMHTGGVGSIDFEFLERDDGFHFKFVHPDGGIAIPSLGMLPQYSSAPHSGVEQEGESYYDTTLNKSRTWDGSAWQNHW